jgi:hypothetical protein
MATPDDEEPDRQSRRARGVFGQFGWRLHQGAESDGIDARLVSAHELHHDRLQVSTAHGFLTHVVAALAVETADARWQGLLAGLQSVARRVHEQFATWTALVTLNLSREDLVDQLPGYLGYFEDVETLAADTESPYLKMHLVHALHRAAMQTHALRIVAERGIRNLRLRDLGRQHRPDWRIGVFDRGALSGFARATAAEWENDDRWPSLQDAVLSDAVYGLAYEDMWNDMNRRAYQLARTVLESRGAPTLDYDGHLEWTDDVLAQARAITGTRLGVMLASEATHGEHADIAIFSMEGETLVVRDQPLPATVVSDAPAVLISGEEPYEHVYVSVRHRERLTSQWRFDRASALGSDDVVAVVRRTVLVDDKRIVEVRPLNDPAELDPVAGIVSGDISMAALGDSAVAERWGSTLGAENSVVLWDLQPSRHVRLWMTEPRQRLRYAVLNAERSGRTTMVFVAQVVTDEGRSRLFVAPASDLFVRAIRAWMLEVGLGDRATPDNGLIAENDRVLQIVLGHMLGEETTFDFLAGRRR